MAVDCGPAAIANEMVVADICRTSGTVAGPLSALLVDDWSCGMPKKQALAFAVVYCLVFTSHLSIAQTVATGFSAPVPATCQFAQPARIATSLRDLPAVAAEFRRLKLEVADVGENFIPFDVEDERSKGLPHRQFVRAYVFKDRTIVWYFRGGFVTGFHVVELTMQHANRAGAPSLLRLTGRTLSGPPCAATEAILAGVNGGQGW